MNTITLQPIGRIHSPFTKPEDMPIQPAAARGMSGSVELFPEFTDGLQDLDGFSHIYLIYYFHLSRGYNLKVIPFLDTIRRGLFSTRAPKRPNQIGLSIVKLIDIKGNRIDIEDVDIIDGTPLLDVKPYVPEMDAPDNCRIGWMTPFKSQIKKIKSDKRFAADNSD
ncbi:MAG: tRNA (N6-threonylcarbamoyladenosine(37)-N6)-methyltransferase TrmO [Desulfobulbaceae bacterium]|nr:tRNA (N6-threonylcarbamoyladenosine(37)-N6)-methyltransferase TrmO [Desulfobulbaceae bacterium]